MHQMNVKSYTKICSLLHFNVLAPQFRSSQLNLSAINASCIKLSWGRPMYSGGTVDQYQVITGHASLLAVIGQPMVETVGRMELLHSPNRPRYYKHVIRLL